MQDIYKYIFENMSFGNIKKQAAIELLDKLKNLEKTDDIEDEVAIVGMALNFPQAQNLDEFYSVLKNRVDCIKHFPEQRIDDIEYYLKTKGISKDYFVGGYLDEIDKFDCNFFNIPPKEAQLMDPNQRLFLQTAWHALEDAGYSGEKIRGTNTGIYLGYSSDFGEEYKTLVQMYEPSSRAYSLPGNIKSIIASRLSYYLDLKGPSMLIDTACSSSLVAVHHACKAIKSGECNMAIAGGVKLNIIPLAIDKDAKFGIESSDGKTKTFDDSSDGTGFGEGVAAIILKSLKRAKEDNDHIYAIIKGSAVNQDGNSIGITAPNAMSQRDLLIEAWKNARIDPETVSYIEAHGTGTKLGDPVEVNGIEMAFKKYTDKKQFCAIGSVKTNIGHLDNAAGIAGLIKIVLSLKSKKIFPTLHFNKPNNKINFIDSPVYVNDKLIEWESNGHPRRCGINSFGLSGTNCHIVLEEMSDKFICNESIPDELDVLTISAKNRYSLEQLIYDYNQFLANEKFLNIKDICYTANANRGHYEYRIAIVARGLNELKYKVRKLAENGINHNSDEGIYYGNHRIIGPNRSTKVQGDVSEEEKNDLDSKLCALVRRSFEQNKNIISILNEICTIYIQGGSVDWEKFYREIIKNKISLPSYPFDKRHCWVKLEDKNDIDISNQHPHKLLDICLIESLDTEIYRSIFSVENDWVVSEHKIMNNYVVPGTTYIEMIMEIAEKHCWSSDIELRNIIFMSPLVVEENKPKETHTIIRKRDDFFEFVVAGLENDNWIRHVEGEFSILESGELVSFDIASLKQKFSNEVTIDENIRQIHAIQTGPRWNVINKINIHDNEYLTHLRLPEKFREDLNVYKLHPALMDFAINAANSIIGTYLPFSYKKIRVCGNTPSEFYSYIKQKNKGNNDQDTVIFDIKLIDMSGRVFVTVEDYSIRKLHENVINSDANMNILNKIMWKIYPLTEKAMSHTEGIVLVLKGTSKICSEVVQKLKDNGKNVIEVEVKPETELDIYNEIKPNVIGFDEQSLTSLINAIGPIQITQIIHMATLGNETIMTEDELSKSQKTGVYNLFSLTKAITANKLKDNIDIILVSDYVNEVTGDEEKINPHNATLFGLGKVIGQEHSNIKCRCIDIDRNTSAEDIISELSAGYTTYNVGYRNSTRYVEELDNIPKENFNSETFYIKEEGLYLITGGTGGLGLEIARYLASKNKVNLVLVSRSVKNGKEKYKSGIYEKEKKKVDNRLTKIIEIEKLGSTVDCCQADVSNEDEMKYVIEYIKNKYGRIDGILHCAGIAGNGFVFKKSLNEFASVLDPKVKGTWILDKLTNEFKLDFFVMFSSVTSIIGGMGQGDYTAANSYLDSFEACRSKTGHKTVTINWPAWKETGMAVDYNFKMDDGIFKPISTASALRAFELIMQNGFKRVIVGKLNPHSLTDSVVKNVLPLNLSINLNPDSQHLSGTHIINKRRNSDISHSNSILDNKISFDSQNIEEKVSQIWSRVLGIEDINIYDTLKEMGGDSITATQLLREIEKYFPKTIDIADIFAYPSISELSKHIRRIIEKNNTEIDKDSQELSVMLEKLSKGEIAIEDIEKIL